jgi:hypothetical protein
VPTNPERFPPVRKTLPPVPKLTEAVETLTADDVYKRADDLSEEFHKFVEECQHEHPKMTQLDRIFQGWMLQKLALIQLIIERIVNGSPRVNLQTKSCERCGFARTRIRSNLGSRWSFFVSGRTAQRRGILRDDERPFFRVIKIICFQGPSAPLGTGEIIK